MAIKLVDTTTQSAHAGAVTLFVRELAARPLHLASQLNFRLIGMYFAKVGPEWGSQGRRESNYMHHIEIALSGRRQVVWQDETMEVEPGKAYFWPGNTPLERRCEGSSEVLFLKFRCEWLPGVDPLLDWPRRHPRCLGPCDLTAWRSWLDPQLAWDARRILELQANLQLWMSRVLVDLDDMIEFHLKTHAQFTPAFQLVERELGADLRVEALARSCGSNRDAFARAFTRSTGISPKEFLNRRLNQEAIQWLVNTDLKIKEIADHLRFSDEFYFSRFFQKLNGISPSRYRQRLRM